MQRDDDSARRGPPGAARRAKAKAVRRPVSEGQTRQAQQNRRRASATKKSGPSWWSRAWTALRSPGTSAPGSGLVARLRSAGLTGSALLALLIAAVLGAGVGLARQWLTTSETFAIDSIEVEGLERVAQADVLGVLGVAPGDSLLAADVPGIERAVRALPWVASARVERQLPRTLHVSVNERRAVALAAAEQGLEYVDADGLGFAPRQAGDHELLPVITGGEGGGDLPTLRRGVLFLDEVRRALGESAPAIAEVHVAPDGAIAVELVGEPQRYELGKEPSGWADAIAACRRVDAALAEHGHRARELRVSAQHPERVVARLEAQRPPPAPDKKSKRSPRGHGTSGRE